MKPVGWRKEPVRHSLAAKGIKTGSSKVYQSGVPYPIGVIQKFYTCTSSEERAKAYRKGQLIVPGEPVRDPGDMGAGLYGDTWRARAKNYGDHCFRVSVDRTKLLHLENPYSPDGVPKWLRDVLYKETKEGWVMQTVQLPWEERIQAAKEVREAVLAKGYCGVYTGSAKFGKTQHIEYAIFSNDCVVAIE